jgi:Lar family restriction alleviation protein
MKEEEMEELKPCPFCGAHAKGGDGPVLRVGELGYHYVFCNGCGSSGPENAFFQTEAIPAWNRRAPPSPS